MLSDRLRALNPKTGSVLCVGIDPDPVRLPVHLDPEQDLPTAVRTFCREIIARTGEHAAAFKFNLAFFEALGSAGLDILKDVLECVPEHAITIADAKRGDIGNSARFYAKAFFDDMGFDMITASPYMGRDSVQPFLDYVEKGVFLLVRTSNSGSDDFQKLITSGGPLYTVVANLATGWALQAPGVLGFVVGAIDGPALVELRALYPDVPFLIPGVGAQGGSAESVVAAAGSGPILVNSSRQIIYASGNEDYAVRAGEAAARLSNELRDAFSPTKEQTGKT